MEIGIIYRQFHSQLLGYVKSKVRSREDAEDILQNVFIRISGNVDKLSEDTRLKNWIFAITKNAIIDYYRGTANKRKLTSTEEITEDLFEPEQSESGKGLDQCITSMISLLPDEYRSIIIESEINGVKQKDLADKHGIAYSSLRSKVQRGRERLKQLFYDCRHIETNKLGNVTDAQGKTDCAEGTCSPCSGIGN